MTNDTPAERAKKDQVMAAWQESIPPMMMTIYTGFLRVGFDKAQALELTKFMWLDIRKDVNAKRDLPEDI